MSFAFPHLSAPRSMDLTSWVQWVEKQILVCWFGEKYGEKDGDGGQRAKSDTLLPWPGSDARFFGYSDTS